jgi:phage repressor protein C with HTH and peptisase S24 domain
MTINERFGLILKNKGMSIKEASVLMGVTEAYIRKLLRPNQSFGIEPTKCILNSFPDVNPTWLLIGEGEILKRETNIIRYVAPYINEELFGVPYVSALVAATFIENLYSMEYDLETYSVKAEDGEELSNGEYIVFDVAGESMMPTIPGGAKILCRKINEEQWEYANGVVVVIYGKTLTVKRILKNDLYNRNAMTLKADNPIHGELTVQRSEIRAMWQATRIISMKIS